MSANIIIGTAFVCAMRPHGQRSFVRGFGAASLGALVFVSFLLVWVYAARNLLVQLPFEHFDVLSSGATTVAAYLDGGGWAEFWRTTVFAWTLMLALVALMAPAGVLFGRVRARLADGKGHA